MNMKKFKYIILAVVIGVFIYHSVYFEPLSERRQHQQQSEFDPVKYVDRFWQELHNQLGNAVAVSELLALLRMDMSTAVRLYGKTLGVSEQHSYLVKGQGEIVEIADDHLLLTLSSSDRISITTDYIFGNDIRDASGLVRVSDFPSTMDFNTISSEINKGVTTQVLPAILDSVTVGDTLRFFGATTVHETSPELDPLPVVPIRLILNPESPN